jgi:Flp pilus assembly protein TadD
MKTTLILATLAVATLGACRRAPAPDSKAAPAAPAARGGQPMGAHPGVTAQLDTGNNAFRAGDYTAALTHYERAAHMNPHLTASWIGVAMAARALGDSALADSAQRIAQTLAPGENLVHPSVRDTAHH